MYHNFFLAVLLSVSARERSPQTAGNARGSDGCRAGAAADGGKA